VLRPLISTAVAIAAIIALIEYLSQPGRYATAIGQTLTLTLPDGSRIILNTNTAITFNRDPDTPLVELQKGEILCDLVENPSRHLAVYVNAMRITDTGTTFSVRRTEAGATLVVRAGTVRVSGEHRPESELVQNQEADIGSDDIVIIELSPDQVRRKLMWQFGRLEFQRDRLSDVIKEINRYSKLPIQVADPHLANVLVTGSLNSADPINTFKALAPQLSWQVENNADGMPVFMLRKSR
jgi:transmembrane sensor